MKFNDFQAPVLFSSTFKALNLGEKNSNTLKDFQGRVGTLSTVQCHWKTRLIPSCGSLWVDVAKLIPLDRFSDALVAEDAPPEYARLA